MPIITYCTQWKSVVVTGRDQTPRKVHLGNLETALACGLLPSKMHHQLNHIANFESHPTSTLPNVLDKLKSSLEQVSTLLVAKQEIWLLTTKLKLENTASLYFVFLDWKSVPFLRPQQQLNVHQRSRFYLQFVNEAIRFVSLIVSAESQPTFKKHKLVHFKVCFLFLITTA